MAVQSRRQPVAGNQHPAADLDIAPFIGQRQRPQGRQQEQEAPQTGNRQPVFLGFSEVTHEKMVARPTWVPII
jgi:hypothetical protein